MKRQPAARSGQEQNIDPELEARLHASSVSGLRLTGRFPRHRRLLPLVVSPVIVNHRFHGLIPPLTQPVISSHRRRRHRSTAC
jgi:hypothetical protein